MIMSEEKREKAFDMVIASVPDAIVDILLAGRDENVDKETEIANLLNMYTTKDVAKNLTAIIIKQSNKKFGYDI